MALDAKEIMLGVRFSGYGTFVSVYIPEGDGRNPIYRFEYLGGQFSVEVSESESLNPPEVGTAFFVQGRVRYNAYNGSIGLIAEEKKRLSDFSAEQFVAGLRIFGAGVVEEKKSTVMNRQTFLRVAIKWQGGLHLFSGLSPELYQKLPQRGSYVRFELGVTSRSERTQGGQQIQLMVPMLVSVTPETLSTSVPKEPDRVAPTPVSGRSESVLGTRAKIA
ncbi:MAG: hypothetical protein LBE12_21105 [Planctomycetaceae bacterium]|jgi:hypothetical protein|nr:hypothetical protein [Planctomycetaceae bacterium]